MDFRWMITQIVSFLISRTEAYAMKDSGTPQRFSPSQNDNKILKLRNETL